MLAGVFSLKRFLNSGPCLKDHFSNGEMTKHICLIKMA